MAAHSSSIKGLAFSVFNERTCFLSAGEDKAIRLWEMESLQHISKKLEGGEEGEYKPKMEYLSKVGLGNVTHAQGENIFATAGDIVQVWNYERSRPVQSFEWGIDTITTLKVNPAQVYIYIYIYIVYRVLCSITYYYQRAWTEVFVYMTYEGTPH